MRGYLIITESGARYIAETNHTALRVLAGSAYPAVGLSAHGRKPGTYRATDSLVSGRMRLIVGKQVDPQVEADRLQGLADGDRYTYHGQGAPGVKGNDQRYHAAESAARARKTGSRLLAQALREMLP